jgi:hypothetical protein
MVSQSYMQSVIGLMTDASARALDISLGLLGQDALITRSRNTLVGQFRRSGASHLLFVDADIGFTPGDVYRLLAAGKDVAGGLYPLRSQRWTRAALERVDAGEGAATAAYEYVGELTGLPGEDGLAPARYAGTGFLLISRNAIERMVEAYPHLRCRHGHTEGGDASLDEHALFDCMIEVDSGLYLSEDFAFCARWRALGGRIWLDTRSTLTHCGMSEFAGDPAVRFRTPEEHAPR